MKRLFLPLAVIAILFMPLAARAQTALGQVVNTFNIAPSKVLADPGRDRVYVLVPADNTLRVIDTTNIQPDNIVQLPVDSIPVDMTLSRDHNTLYIANSGTTVNAISVVGNLDAATPTYLRSISLAGPGLGVASAVDANSGDDLLFVLTAETLIIQDPKNPLTPPTVQNITPVLVVDATMGTTVTQVGDINVVHNLVGTNTDGTSVVVAGSLGLETFSVADQTMTSANPTIGATAVQLIISNTGAYFCVPDPKGNNNGTPLTTLLFDEVNPPGYYGTFSDPATPGPLAFNSDDSLIYQLRFDGTGAPEVLVFDTQTFLETNAAPIPTNNLTLSITGRNTIALERTNSLLFVGASTSSATNSPGQLVILSTGSGPLNPFQPPVIVTTSLPDGAVSQSYSATILASFSPTSYGASGLPNGLTVNPTTGVISGTPTTGGTFNVVLSATNSFGTGTATVSLTITGMSIQPPVITSPAVAADPNDGFFTYQITATNNPLSFGATGLPAGLTVNTATGLISGTPTSTGVFTVTLSANNLGGTGTGTLTLTVTLPPRPVITSATAVTDQIDMAFNYQITASNNPTSFDATGLPTGLTVDTITGVITGIPTASGTFSISLRATNVSGTGTSILTLTVTPLPATTVTSPAASTGTVGQAFSYQITATNMAVSYTANGLPPGLSVNTATGLITGTPLMAGTFAVTLTATNASSTGTFVLTLTIASNVPTIEIMTTVSRVTAGTNDHAAITISRTGDLSQPLIVAYSIKGSARNGTDYNTLSGRQKIKANRASATIQIVPEGTLTGNIERGVKITLLPAVTYQLDTVTKAKVKIEP